MRPAIRTSVRVCIPMIAVVSVLLAAAPPALSAPETDAGAGIADICRSVVGLSPGMEHFDRCVASLDQSLGTRRVSDVRPGPTAGTWFRASFEERRGRVERACGLLGLEPGSRAYRGCVTRLAAALYAADHPQP